MFEKTNLRNWVTWTFDPFPETGPETEPEAGADPPLPTPLDFVMVILPELRRFPDAYHAMLAAIRHHWPFLARKAPPPLAV